MCREGAYETLIIDRSQLSQPLPKPKRYRSLTKKQLDTTRKANDPRYIFDGKRWRNIYYHYKGT